MKKKIRLSVFFFSAILLLTMTALPAAAGPGPGNSPRVAHPLREGLNVGILEPGETSWYVIDSNALGEPSGQMMVLNMIYRPGDHDVAPYVNFQILGFEQVDRWLQGYTDSYMGMGVFTTTDFDQETSERLWSGDLLQDQTYYVRLFNNSSKTVEFHLMALSQQLNTTATEPQARVVETGMERVGTTAHVEPASTAPRSTSADATFKPAATLVEAQWQLVAAAVQSMSADEAAAWLQMASRVGWLPGSGGGSSASAVNVSATTVEADTEASPPAQPLDAPAESPMTEMAESKDAAPQPVSDPSAEATTASLFDLYPNVYPNTPLALHDGANVGKMAPGGEHWYSFIREDLDDRIFEHMALTLFSTPSDGNESHHINFQIFTGSQLHIWQRGTPKDMVPMGEGQWVSRDNDAVTGERLWAGMVVDGDTYYVRVFNNSRSVIDYYLITNDIRNTELGSRVYAANQFYPLTLWQPGSNIPRKY